MSHVHGREGHHYFSDVPPELMKDVSPAADRPWRLLPEELTDPGLDRLASLAANLTGCPVARISVIDDKWVVCRASVGAPRLIVPAEQSFCALARRLGYSLAVNKPAEDERFADLTTLSHNQGVQFYAAEPLMNANGHIIGILSLRDVLPHTLDDSEKATLKDIAALAVDRLEVLADQADRKQATFSSRALKMAGTTLGLAYWRYDASQGTLVASEGFHRLVGLPPTTPLSYLSLVRRVDRKDRARVLALLHRALRRRIPFSIQFSLIDANGDEQRLAVQGECDSENRVLTSAFGIAFHALPNRQS